MTISSQLYHWLAQSAAAPKLAYAFYVCACVRWLAPLYLCVVSDWWQRVSIVLCLATLWCAHKSVYVCSIDVQWEKQRAKFCAPSRVGLETAEFVGPTNTTSQTV